MATKTIVLTGTEKTVTGLDGAHAHIRNDGTEVIYASKKACIAAGTDGVLSIPAGSSGSVYGICGNICLIGTGSATVVSSDYTESPFKASAQAGGSGADEVARAAINAHAGSADIHVTSEEKAAWSAVNYSNPNLLINPDFRINQRGELMWNYGDDLGRCVDTWKINCGSLGNSGLIVCGTSYLIQELEGDFNNLPLVLSVVQADEKMTHISFVTGEIEGYYNTTGDDLFIEFGHKPQSNSYVSINALTNDATLKYAKLEIGSTATPFCPPNPATELAKCQRYYQIRSTGDIAEVDLRPTMRVTPTVTQLSDGNYAYSAEL